MTDHSILAALKSESDAILAAISMLDLNLTGEIAANHAAASGGVTDRFSRLLVVVTGVVFAALRFWLHCPDCGSPV